MFVKKNMLLIVAILALGFGFFASKYFNPNKKFDPNLFHGTILSQARDIDSFALTGIDNKPYTNQSLKNHWTMIFFGFTSCPDLCPTTMAELNKMYQILQQNKVKNLPNVVMISLDPEMDTLDKLSSYVKTFNPNFFAASADKDAIAKLTQELGVAYSKIASAGENYTIDHTGTVMLFNPEGKLAGFFTTPHNAAFLAQDYAKLVA